MSWFNRKDKKISEDKKKNIPSGLWIKCPTCSEIKYKPELEKNFSVCIGCNHHFRVSPNIYRDLIFDNNSFSQLFKNVKSADPLSFKAHKEYKDQIISAVKKQDITMQLHVTQES